MRRERKFTSISLFSGCGGLDLGLSQAGFETVLALDADPLCAATYHKNFPKVRFINERIGVLSESIFSGITREFGEIDLVAGGPPCPPFSKSRFYRKEKPRGLDDPTAFETITGFLSVVRSVRPRAFILENVKGLSYGVHSEALQTILSRAKRLGYEVQVAVLNAADYGVPQMRERCIIVGTLDGGFRFPLPSHSKSEERGLSKWIPVGDVLADLDTDENACDRGHFAGGKHHDLLRQVPPGDNYLFFTKERGHRHPKFLWRSRYWSFLLKLSPDLPSWTIQARRSNNMGPLHWRNRILRISEIKRIQTFPDNFDLAGTTEQQWRQLGNAVPPLLAKKIGVELASCLRQRRSLARAA
jgi:DNA (cytosine-5)-methyltransferase 1